MPEGMLFGMHQKIHPRRVPGTRPQLNLQRLCETPCGVHIHLRG
jgi:hypothetical protein